MTARHGRSGMSKTTWNSPPNWPAPPAGWSPPSGWQPDPAWGPAPAGWQFTAPRKSRTKLIVGGSLGGALLLTIIIGVSVGGSGTNTSDTAGGGSVDQSAPVAPADDDMAKTAAWIDKTQGDTHSVQVAVQSVQGGIKLVQDGATDAASQAALSSLVKQSQDFLHDASLGLVTEIDDPLKSQREEAFQAANQLSDAMSKLRSYIDSSKPSDLADFQTNYQQGVQDWNEAVTKIWAAAGRSTPPTV